MKTIQELENELAQRRRDESEAKRREEYKKEEIFRKAEKIDVYTSDDYCGMTNGKYDFYYGYEVTECAIKSHRKNCEDNGCEKREWCFTASVDNKEVMKIRKSLLWHDSGDEPFFYLLAGIARFIRENLN